MLDEEIVLRREVSYFMCSHLAFHSHRHNYSYAQRQSNFSKIINNVSAVNWKKKKKEEEM